MCIYVYIYMYTNDTECILCIYIYTAMYRYTYLYICNYRNMYNITIWIWLNRYMWYVCIYIYILIYIHIYIYIFSHRTSPARHPRAGALAIPSPSSAVSRRSNVLLECCIRYYLIRPMGIHSSNIYTYYTMGISIYSSLSNDSSEATELCINNDKYSYIFGDQNGSHFPSPSLGINWWPHPTCNSSVPVAIIVGCHHIPKIAQSRVKGLMVSMMVSGSCELM